MASDRIAGPLRSAGRAWRALASHVGLAGGERSWILMLHGTPRSDAAALVGVLRYLKQHFHVVALADIALAAPQDRGQHRWQVALTFDDGLRNNVQVAYPILCAFALPATFFICPQLVDEGARLWNHEARLRLRRLAAGDLAAIAGTLGAEPDVDSVIEAMKLQRMPARRETENRLRRATPGFSATDAERHDYDLASWPELRSLDARLITVGSHTLTHPILPQLDAAEMNKEVAESRRQLEARLDRAVELFAYPNGAATPAVRAAVALSYDAAVTADAGDVGSASDRYLLPRVNVPWSPLRLALAMHSAPASGGGVEGAGTAAPT